MIIVLKRGLDKKTIEDFSASLKKKYNVEVNQWQGVNETVLGLIGDTTAIDIGTINAQDVVYSVRRVQEPYKKANRKFHLDDTVITLSNGTKIGDGSLTLMAGPCSVESAEQVTEIAKAVKAINKTIINTTAIIDIFIVFCFFSIICSIYSSELFGLLTSLFTFSVFFIFSLHNS